MRKKILLLAVLVVASATTIDAQRKFPFFWKKKKAKTEQTTPAKKESEYDKLFKKKHETAKGLITLHLLDGKVYFELPVDLINKDMLIGSTVTSISDNGNAVVGSKPTDLLHVMFTRNKTHVQLRQVNTDYITGSTQIDEALHKSTLGWRRYPDLRRYWRRCPECTCPGWNPSFRWCQRQIGRASCRERV